MNAENTTPAQLDNGPADYLADTGHRWQDATEQERAEYLATTAEAPEYDPDQDEADEPEEEEEDPLFSEENRATYCPEDDKLRLYVGRVPRAEYEALRAEGWTSTPKQDCDFVAIWTPARRRTAERYAGIIEDEDAGPADRAADRAERFTGYREKRRAEAHGHADRYDAPRTHGYQSQARADRAAARHDRHGTYAVDAWSKAEYWQRRTAGVISHALHLSTPAVRMGRIKTLEAELRKAEKSHDEYRARYQRWQHVAAQQDPEKAHQWAYALSNENGNGYHYKHPRPETATEYMKSHGTSLYSLLTHEPDPITGHEAAALWIKGRSDPAEAPENESVQHLRHRLAYENQMLEAQGGRAAFIEMEAGGWLGAHQIHKVNKSNATGRVVSVELRYTSNRNKWGNDDGKGERELSALIKTERMGADVYRPPTDEEREAFKAGKKAAKAAAPKADACPLINPTEADAEQLQRAWNAYALADHCQRFTKAYGKDYAADFKPSTVCRCTQEQYSRASQGAYGTTETRTLHHSAQHAPRASNMYSGTEKAEKEARGPAICKVRLTLGDGSTYGAKRVIILTDKPQKPLPAAVWTMPAPKVAAEPQQLTQAALAI